MRLLTLSRGKRVRLGSCPRQISSQIHRTDGLNFICTFQDRVKLGLENIADINVKLVCFIPLKVVITSKGGVTNPTPIYEKYSTDV